MLKGYLVVCTQDFLKNYNFSSPHTHQAWRNVSLLGNI